MLRLAITALLAGTAAAYDIMICQQYLFADGFIYHYTDSAGKAYSSLPSSFSATESFPLYLSVINTAPMDAILLTKAKSTHNYIAYDRQLYANVSTGAFEPMGFTEAGAGNATLGAGETTWGFYDALGFIVRIPTGATRLQTQGFQWVPVNDTPYFTQLYWNQTQYDIASAGGTISKANSATANFGQCYSDDSNPTITGP